jgi:hypothetical protein
MKTMTSMKKQELTPMKKFVIREAETLKTTAATLYTGDC